MTARPGQKHVIVGVLCLLFLSAGALDTIAQDREPSPIEIEIITPQTARPGQTIDVLINYRVIDPNASAMINYNHFGPGHIQTRTPEPPDPTLNTWGPKFDPLQGTIKIQIRIAEGTDDQKLRHDVQVIWGLKSRQFSVETQIKRVLPAPTRIPTPTPLKPTLGLSRVVFLDAGATTKSLVEAKANTEIAFAIQYASSGDLENVTIRVLFEPDLVNLDGFERADAGYILAVPSLPAAPSGAALPASPFIGRIQAYADGGEQYELRAIVEISAPQDTIANVPEQIVTDPLQVIQHSSIIVRASVNGEAIRTGGAIIVHAFCDNPGQVTVRDIALSIHDLPEDFVVQPEEQIIDHVHADGGFQERIFTIRTPEDLEGEVTFKLAAKFGDTVVESEPVIVDVIPPVPLTLDISADKSTVRAGDSVYFSIICRNEGHFTASNVTVRLIDTASNFGVLLQDLGTVKPGESRESAFVIEIPDDFPADVVSSMVAQTISGDGTLSESAITALTVVCVPSFELLVHSPANRLMDDQFAEIIVSIRNISQCTARDVAVSVGELPETLIPPSEHQIAELSPGQARHITFSLFIPDGHPPGKVAFPIRVTDSLGTQVKSSPAGVTVGGVSMVFTVLFGLLILLAANAIVVGIALFIKR